MIDTVVLLADDSEQTLHILPRVFKRLWEIAPPIDRLEIVYLRSKEDKWIKDIIDKYKVDICYCLKIDQEHTNFQQLIKHIYKLLSDKKVEVVLSGNSQVCKECAAGLAYLFDTGLVADCNGLTFDKSKGKFCFERLIGDFPPKSAFITVENTLPQMATFIDISTDDTMNYSVMRNETAIFEITYNSFGIKKKTKKNLNIQNSFSQYKMFFIIGAGVSSFENAEMLRIFSFEKKIGFGITRQILNRGWYDESYLVGISGMKISPNVCITFGVSGTYQHYVGIKDSKFIISINKDISAPMVNYAHKTIIADANEIITGLTKSK